MPKLTTLSSITSGYLSNEQIDSNFSKITTAFNNTISRDGSTPNTMTTNFDMNGQRIINLPSPTSNSDAATKGWVTANYGDLDAADAAESFLVTATATSTARTLGDRFIDIISVKDYGAIGDGTTDDTAAFILAEARGGVISIPSGTYKITSDQTFTFNMLFTGGVISVASTKTITINGTINADLVQIFTGSGTVVGANTSCTLVHPEWWGAVPDGLAVSPTDSTTAIQAAINYSSLAPIYFAGMYAVTGVSTTRDALALVSFHTPPSKNNDAVAGLSAYGNQDYVLRMGDGTNAPNEAAESGWHGITFDGRDKTIAIALVQCDHLSQSACIGVTYRKAYGAGIKFRKGEDLNFINCQFMYLGYNAAGNDTGAIILDRPLNDNVYSNIIRFSSGCRFEFIDGGVLRFADSSLSAIGGLFISSCKIEMGVSGVYGSHAANYGIIHLIQDAHSYMCTDIVVRDNWIARCDRVACILRLSSYENITFTGNELSGAGTAVKLFDIQTAASGTTTGKMLKFKDNTFRDYNNTGSMSFTHTYKSTYPADFEYPLIHGYRAPQIYRDRLDNVYDAQIYSRNALVVADPDSTDPCHSLLGAIPAVSGSNTTILMNIGASTSLPKVAGLKAGSQGLVRLKVRCKKAGNTATAIIGVYTDGGTTLLTNITVPSYFWETVEVYLNLREVYNSQTGIQFVNSASNNAAHTIYVDTIQISHVDFIKKASVPTTGTWDDGDKVYYTDAVSLGFIGEVCTTKGTFGTLSAITANTTDTSNAIVVSSSSNIRVGMYLTTAAGGFTAAKVLNVNGTSVTLNAVATSTQVATSVSYSVPVFKTFGVIS